jgi:type II secretory pathway pseudopilin PulG
VEVQHDVQPRTPGTDDGSSLVEIIVSVVLIGLLVVAMLFTMAAATSSSAVDRDHINAHAWLQSAADVLYGYDRLDCGTETASNEAAIRQQYQDYVRANSTNPEGWDASNLDVLAPVLFWDGKQAYGPICYDDSGINLQLIRLRVTAPDGRIIETVEVVKG